MSVKGGVGGVIVIVQLMVTTPVVELPEESTTWAVKLNGPATVGVPPMAPVAGFRVNPVGSAPAMIENV